MLPTILLFDIDGTLLLTGGAGHRAMSAAFEAVLGTAEPVRALDFRGMTDGKILRAALAPELPGGGHPAAHGRSELDSGEHTRASLELELLNRYLVALVAELQQTEARVIPGVVPLLDALASHAGSVALGLGTGNVQAGAAAKLKRVGLWERFAFGGFGDDGEERADVLAAGRARGRTLLPAAERVVVIGDTPLDVAAALAIGADCLAVCTGGFAAEALHAAGATAVVETLEQPAALSFLCR